MAPTKKTAPATSTRPPVAQMVTAALKDLKRRKGVSLHAIKKYITTNYKADIRKLALYIRLFLRKAVDSGVLLQVKGTGATGSFRLNKAYKPAVHIPRKMKTPQRSKTPKGPAPSAPKKAKTPPVSTSRIWRPISFNLL